MLRNLYRSIGIIAIVIAVLCYQADDLRAREGVILTSVSKEYANGLDVRILKVIARNLGMKLEIRHASFARRLIFLEEGKIDICAGVYKTPEREKYIYFTQSQYKTSSSKYFFVLKGKKSTIQKYEDLYDLDVGTGINSLYFERFDNDQQLSKVRTGTTEQRFKMLLLNRIDAVIQGFLGGQAVINKLGIGDKIEIAEYYHQETRPAHVGISRKSPLMENLDEIEFVIRKMTKNGEFKRICDEYIAQILASSRHTELPPDQF